MMKKFLLVFLLCFAPILATHAADITRVDCETWNTPERNIQDLPPIIQETLKTQQNLKQWTTDIVDFQDTLSNVCSKVAATKTNSPEESRLLQKATLSVAKTLADYKALETRKRMPFVHDGNVLPGPSAEEDESFYVEQKFIPKFVNGTLIFLMSLSILMIIIGGLMFLFSSGDSDLTARAKTTIMWSIIGVIITILAYAIVQFIIGIDFGL